MNPEGSEGLMDKHSKHLERKCKSPEARKATVPYRIQGHLPLFSLPPGIIICKEP